jgi:sulfate transport system permease protein
VRWVLILAAVGAVGVLVLVPVINVFYEALARGVGTYVKNLLADPDTRHSIGLTLTVAPVAVVLNVLFGVAAAWAIARYQFCGRTLLITLIDLPL